ncbi:MAG: hypothetical protein CFH19_00235 [Alphaproteobacteria bacterium MarineAlpha5_Bin9]|nr:MAG: hypothetical protein CFH19_00235 [Alphaproteobacteria bacterium MarineAlpha5_Bin9]|tara:strand:+ start:11291 stop:11899 length:609 start_codon:yes stop_codon:yes gene_type:complete
MLVKDRFLKKVFRLISIFLIIFSITSKTSGNENSFLKDSATNYLNKLNEFSSTFLQINNNDTSEGKIYIKDKNIRIEYTSPSNIIFIIKNNKGVYYNVDLEELQYFNPKKTIGSFFIELFQNKNYLNNTTPTRGEGYLQFERKVIIEEQEYNAKIVFEINPIQIRKIEVVGENEIISFTILSPIYNIKIDQKLFSLVNPLLD